MVFFGLVSSKELGDIYTMIENPKVKKDFIVFVIFFLIVCISIIYPFIVSIITFLIELFRSVREEEEENENEPRRLNQGIIISLFIASLSRWILAMFFNKEYLVSTFLFFLSIIIEAIMAGNVNVVIPIIHVFVIGTWGYYFKFFNF